MSLPFAIENVRTVTFYKRDEITTDLICCDVEVDGAEGAWFNHEESDSWADWIDGLASLPGFDANWFTKVSHPTFAPSVTIAFERTR